MDLNDILIKCDGYNFVKDRAVGDRTLTIEEVITICEELYNEVKNLKEELEDLEADLEENYKPICKLDMFSVSERDFI